MSYKVLLIFFALGLPLLSAKTTAQTTGMKGSISGQVLDSATRGAVEFATISLYRAGTKAPITGTTSDRAGNFLLTGIAPGTGYQVIIEFIGLKPVRIPNIALSVEIPRVILKPVFLASRSKFLKGVTVTAQKDLVENRIDKLVYNVEKDVTSQGGVATDVLQKVPQVFVDVDGNVELAGSSSIRFLINGKPSSAFGSNIADVLQSIPASQIKSIEVITNPGAKYDAQGLGGIINIILKQNNAQGINGTVSITGGTRNENGSFNINARKGKFGLNAFVSGNDRRQVLTQNSSDTYRTIDSGRSLNYLHSAGASMLSRSGIQSGVGFDWALSKRTSLTGGVNYEVFKRSNPAETTQFSSTTPAGSPKDTTARQNLFERTANSNMFRTVDANVDWKTKFTKPDQELEIVVTSSLGHGNTPSESERYYLPVRAGAKPFFGDSTANPGKDHETEISVDYSQPLQKGVILGFGGKVNLRSVVSTINANRLDSARFVYVLNPALSSMLRYKDQIYALYTELSFPFKELVDVKLGIRYQHTAINAFFSNAGPGQPSPPGYNSFLPSVFLSRKLGHDQLIKLSYSRRIEPPRYNDLDPYINTTDPYNLTRGNPYLKPEIADRLEFAVNTTLGKAGSLTLTLYYRTSNQDIQPYSVLYPVFYVGQAAYRNVNVITNQNIGLEEDPGINVYSAIQVTNKVNLRSNLTFFERYTTNAIDKGLNAQSFNYRINANLDYTASKDFIIEFAGAFRSARNEVQGHYPAFTNYSLALRKQFVQGKASFAFVAGNFFSNDVRQPLSIHGVNFITSSERRIPYRTFGLNLTWKFGGLKFKKDKDDRSGGLESSPDGT